MGTACRLSHGRGFDFPLLGQGVGEIRHISPKLGVVRSNRTRVTTIKSRVAERAHQEASFGEEVAGRLRPKREQFVRSAKGVAKLVWMPPLRFEVRSNRTLVTINWLLRRPPPSS